MLTGPRRVTAGTATPSRSLRVLIAHPGAELYGSDRVVLAAVDALCTAGHHVTVSLPHDGPLVAPLRQAGAQVTLGETPVLRKTLLTPRGLLTLVRQSATGAVHVRRTLREVRPDVVYVNTVTQPLWILLSRLWRIPVLCHVHEAERHTAVALRRLLLWPLLLTQRVVANSRYTAEVLGDAYACLPRTAVVVTNPVALARAVPPASAPLGPQPRLLYLGRLSTRKGVDVAIAALAVLRASGTPARLHVVGDVFTGYESVGQDLHQQATDLGVADAITWTGFLTDVTEAFDASDIVVVPSRGDETFGNVAVEAVLAGRPVIVSDHSGLREAVHDVSTAHRVPADDAVALADALRGIVLDWEHTAAELPASQQAMRQRHAPHRFAAAIVAIIEELSQTSVQEQL